MRRCLSRCRRRRRKAAELARRRCAVRSPGRVIAGGLLRGAVMIKHIASLKMRGLMLGRLWSCKKAHVIDDGASLQMSYLGRLTQQEILLGLPWARNFRIVTGRRQTLYNRQAIWTEPCFESGRGPSSSILWVSIGPKSLYAFLRNSTAGLEISDLPCSSQSSPASLERESESFSWSPIPTNALSMI